jgi:hypothetical protein
MKIVFAKAAGSRTLTTVGEQAHIFYADDFCEFVRKHGRDVVVRRLTYDALWFLVCAELCVSSEPRGIVIGKRNVPQAGGDR